MRSAGWWRRLIVVCVLVAGRLGFAQDASGGAQGAIDLREGREQLTVVSGGAWLFHAGDDPTWAKPDIDDHGWRPLKVGKAWDPQGYKEENNLAWFRFRIIAPSATHDLVIEMPGIGKNYQLFANGQLIGQVGGMPPEPSSATVRAARLFTVPVKTGNRPATVVMALRMWQSPQYAFLSPNVLGGQVRVGAPETMVPGFARTKAWSLVRRVGMEYTSMVIQVPIAAAALLLFLLTRQKFYVWFSLNMAISVLALATRLASSHFAWDFGWMVAAFALWDFAGGATLAMFLAGLLEVKRPRLLLLAIVLLGLAEAGPLLVSLHLSFAWADGSYFLLVTAGELLVLWLGWRARQRGPVEAALFLVPFAVSSGLGDLGNLGHFLEDRGWSWAGSIIPSNVTLLESPFPVNLLDLANVLALFGFLAVLVYRFALTSREEQRLSAALRAAHEIQGRLVPGNQRVHEGLRTEVVYVAAEEVGGDFCQVLPRASGSTLVAIGDVSGKGLQAAMVGALAVGALRSMAEEGVGPGTVLARMNEVMLRSDVQGFITCLCVEIGIDGEMTMANAGHLSPYVNGKELDCGGGLPLGMVGGVRYEECRATLPREARLTLLSDGVVEARSETGELFGFDRTLEMSGSRAGEIADAARQFGQQDDITVMTLEWSAPRGTFGVALCNDLPA